MENKTAHVKLLEPCTFQGGLVEEKEVLEIPARSAAALVSEGKASFCDENGDAVKNSVGEELPTDEEVKENEEADEKATAKALDAQYKRDELAEAAKKIDVEFAYDAKKAAIIKAIIDQGKAEALLK